MQKQYDMEIEYLEEKIEKTKKFKKKSYESYLDGILTKEEYAEYAFDYDKKIKELNAQKETLVNNINVQQEIDTQYDKWVEGFINYIHIDSLTRELVLELIERIEVNHDGSIDVYYRFQNPYANVE